MYCFLLHNSVWGKMAVDPLDKLIDNWSEDGSTEDEPRDTDYVDGIESITGWNRFRDELAHKMWAVVWISLRTQKVLRYDLLLFYSYLIFSLFFSSLRTVRLSNYVKDAPKMNLVCYLISNLCRGCPKDECLFATFGNICLCTRLWFKTLSVM